MHITYVCVHVEKKKHENPKILLQFYQEVQNYYFVTWTRIIKHGTAISLKSVL